MLGEFGTSAEEEVPVVSFQAACQKYHPCFSLLVSICLLHLGLETVGSEVVRPPTMKWMPEPWFGSLRSGANCRVDFSDGWNFWPYVKMPVDEARSRLGISPRTSARS